MKTASKKVAAYIFAGVSVYVILIYYLEISYGGNPWKTGDWLINYSSGFVRRGAFGEFALLLSNVLGLDLLWTVFLLQALLFSIVFFLVLVIFFVKERSSAEFLILFSPAFLLFPVYDLQGGFRKEILVYVPFLIYVLYLLRGRLPRQGIFLVVALFALALFSHELSVSVLPFFLLVTFLFFDLKIIEERCMYLLIASFVALAGIAFTFSIFFSGIGKSGLICSHLALKGLNQNICDGAIKYLEQGRLDAIKWVLLNIIEKNYLFTYGAALTLALLPFFFMKSTCISYKYIISFLVFAFFFFLPLYIFAIDWGRWIHIYIFLLSVLVFAMTSLGLLESRAKIPVILIVAYAVLWSIPHCCSEGLGTGAGNYFIEIILNIERIII